MQLVSFELNTLIKPLDFLGSEFQGPHMDALKQLSSKLMTFTPRELRFLKLFSKFSPFSCAGMVTIVHGLGSNDT